MSNLKPLNWVDTTKGIDRVYCENTDTYIDGAVLFCSTLVADYVIRKNRYGSGFTINYGGRTEPEYDTLEEAKHWCEFTHYASKMQPYVKSSPTWIDAKNQLPQVDKDTQFICAYNSALEPYVKTTTFSAGISEFWNSHDSVLAWMPIPEFKDSDYE